MPLRLAVATENLHSNLKQAIGIAANAQVGGVQLNSRTELEQAEASESSLKQIRLYVTEREMKIAGLFCPTRHTLYEEEFLEPRLNVIRKSMNIARTLQTNHVMVKCGPIPHPDSNAEQNNPEPQPNQLEVNPFGFDLTPKPEAKKSSADRFQMLVEILNDLTQHGNHVGCRLGLLVPNYNRDLIQSLLNQVKNGPISLTFDPASAELSGESAVDAFRDLYKQVSYVRARDIRTNSDGGGEEVPIGSGIVDWTHFIPTLAEADFDGWATVHQSSGPESLESCLQGVSRLKELFPQNQI